MSQSAPASAFQFIRFLHVDRTEVVVEVQKYRQGNGRFGGGQNNDEHGEHDPVDGRRTIPMAGDLEVWVQGAQIAIKPVGASQVRKIDVRIICASNRSLKGLVENETFLKDLYYRLRVISIEIPPLRERKEDVPLLADHFLQYFAS